MASKTRDEDTEPIRTPTPTIEQWKRVMSTRPKLPQLIADVHPDAPGEFSIVSGRTGIGKTNLQLHMAFSLATGTPFLGMTCAKVGVNMLTFEGPEDNVLARVEKVEKHYPDPGGRLHFEFLPMKSPGTLFDTVASRLHDTPGCKVAIIDAVKFLVPGDYLQSKFAGPFIQAFKELLSDVGMSAIIALPIKKPQNQGQLIDPTEVYSIKGATEWVDTAISVLLLEKRMRFPDTEKVLGFAKGRTSENGRAPTINLTFDHEQCLFVPNRSDDGSSTITLVIPPSDRNGRS